MNASLMRRIRHLQRWNSGTIRVLGLIEIMLAVSLIVTAVFAAIAGEDAMLFAWIIPIVGGFGLFQVLFFSAKSKLTPAMGVLLIAEMWVISFVVCAVPFMLYGFSVVDAFFESISGYTTTGATIVPDLDVLPDSLLLWRAITQWTGGITVLISFSFILPMIGMAGAGLNSNEFAGADSDNYSMKISSASLNFLKVYILLTVAEVISLSICNVHIFDAVCIAMSNIPTGGLLPRNDSMASYSFLAQLVTLIFMILGSANFYLMFRLFFKRDTALLKNKETRAMLIWFLICTVFVFMFYVVNTSVEPEYLGETAWDSLYAVVSSGTGTGFSIMDYSHLSTFTMLVLLVAEFMGGASGSTAGGIKIYRMMTLKSYVMSNINRVMHPNAVVSIRSDGKNMGEEAVSSALATIFLFLLGMFISLGLLMFFEPGIGDLQNYFGIILAALANAGISPIASYDGLEISSKILMCFLMWIGRMEIILVLVMFTKGFWTDVRLSIGQFSSGKMRRNLRKR